MCGLHHSISDSELESIVQFLESQFLRTLPLVSKAFGPTEQRPTDMYVVLEAQILWQLWTASKKDVYFWKAVVMLEFALKLSPANYHFRFLLIKFYNQAGKIYLLQVKN